jgi:hypothetical protein
MIDPMSIRIAIVALGVACGAPAAAPIPANRSVATAPVLLSRTVSVPEFGEVAIEDGALQLMDRGSGDGRVHVITVSRAGATKSSWDDKPGSPVHVDTGAIVISGEERTQLRSWAEQLWQLAPGGRRSFSTSPPDGKPPYLWAIVVRRGDEVRMVDGGALDGTSTQPDILEGVVDFLDMHF